MYSGEILHIPGIKSLIGFAVPDWNKVYASIQWFVPENICSSFPTSYNKKSFHQVHRSPWKPVIFFHQRTIAHSRRVCPSQQVNGSSSRFSLRRVRSDVRSQERVVHALLHVPYLVGGNGEVGLRTYLASKQTNVVFPLVRSGLLFRHTPGSQQTI